jgi:hypothetical protein
MRPYVDDTTLAKSSPANWSPAPQEVSRLEYRSNTLLSTLAFRAGTGGELHLVVRYPDGALVELLVSDE